MNNYLHLQLNLFPFIAMGMILVNSVISNEHSSNIRFVRHLVALQMLLFVLDTFSYYLNRMPGKEIHTALILINSLYYMLVPAIAMSWFVYSYRRITKHTFLYYRLMALWLLPGVFLIAAIVLKFEVFFAVSDDNNYERQFGYRFIPPVAIVYFLLASIYAFAALAKTITKERRIELLYITIFPVFPIIGSIVQSFSYGFTFTWSGLALSNLVVYMNLRNQQILIDPLTGLYNRGQFDLCLHNRCGHYQSCKKIFLMLMDINNFKDINDTYGHIKGDKALIFIAHVLRGLFEKKGMFLCRYGGDEFAVIFFNSDEDAVKAVSVAINDILEELNQDILIENGLTCKITVSIGYAQFGTENTKTAEQLIAAADEMMYQNKNDQKRNIKNRG